MGLTSLVLTWTDFTSLRSNQYAGYKIERNTNYHGWDSIALVKPQAQFFKDTTLDPSGEYMYIYRIIAVDSATRAPVSKYSNEAGTTPISVLGFTSVVFDAPTAIKAIRWAPSVWEIYWAHSGTKPELGFVVQALNTTSHYVTVPIDKGDTLSYPKPQISSSSSRWLTAPGDWFDLDTLGENDNHFFTKGPILNGYPFLAPHFRVYAFYSDEFSRLISEFTDEISAPAAYDASITFTKPDIYARMLDSTGIDFSWNPTHKGIEPYSSGFGSIYTQKVQWELLLTNGTTTTTDSFPLAKKAFQKTGLTWANICSVSLSVRLVWLDVYGIQDKTDWAVVGTKPGTDGNLTDKNKVCKQ